MIGKFWNKDIIIHLRIALDLMPPCMFSTVDFVNKFYDRFLFFFLEDLMSAAMSFMRARMNDIVHQPNFTSLPKDIMVEIIQSMTEKMSLND